MKRKSILAVALENLAEDGQVEGTEGTQTTEGTEAPATAEAAPALSEEDLAVVVTEQEAEAEAADEAAELEVAVEELNEELTEAQGDAERVAEVAEQLETSAENGGLPPEAAASVEIATESLLAKYDLSMKHQMPALESFSDQRTRSAQTRYAAESFSEKAKEIGAKVWNGIKAVIKWLQDLFAKYLTVAGRLEARAKKVKEAAGKAKDAKQQEVDFGGYLSKAKALAIDGKLPTSVAASVEEVVQAAFKATAPAAEVKRIGDNISKASEAFKKSAGNSEDFAAFAKVIESAEELILNFYGRSAAAADATEANARTARSSGYELPESNGTLATQVLPGNKVIWGSFSKDSDGVARFGIATKKQEFKSQKVSTLSIADINKLADSAIRAASLKKVIGEISAMVNSLNSVISGVAIGEKINEEGKVNFRENFKLFVQSVRNSVALSGAFHRPAVQVALATASAGLDLAQASLKVYGVEPSAEEKK